MPPGSTWSDKEGFSIQSFNYENKSEYINYLMNKNKENLVKQYEIEDRTKANYLSFKTYFDAFLEAVPFWLRI